MIQFWNEQCQNIPKSIKNEEDRKLWTVILKMDFAFFLYKTDHTDTQNKLPTFLKQFKKLYDCIRNVHL
ncbi:hypothetical protein GE061_011434 [Apolygus lucorum]|uniref:Uncharacterized protein n=1 Tax=Apolygus lucorum TaxID=248454 RepID=A0A8S9XXB0_APOLU|nr:hypothetical protein GE061_011434 [Apolygus lucorum]